MIPWVAASSFLFPSDGRTFEDSLQLAERAWPVNGGGPARWDQGLRNLLRDLEGLRAEQRRQVYRELREHPDWNQEERYVGVAPVLWLYWLARTQTTPAKPVELAVEVESRRRVHGVQRGGWSEWWAGGPEHRGTWIESRLEPPGDRVAPAFLGAPLAPVSKRLTWRGLSGGGVVFGEGQPEMSGLPPALAWRLTPGSAPVLNPALSGFLARNRSLALKSGWADGPWKLLTSLYEGWTLCAPAASGYEREVDLMLPVLFLPLLWSTRVVETVGRPLSTAHVSWFALHPRAQVAFLAIASQLSSGAHPRDRGRLTTFLEARGLSLKDASLHELYARFFHGLLRRANADGFLTQVVDGLTAALQRCAERLREDGNRRGRRPTSEEDSAERQILVDHVSEVAPALTTGVEDVERWIQQTAKKNLGERSHPRYLFGGVQVSTLERVRLTSQGLWDDARAS